MASYGLELRSLDDGSLIINQDTSSSLYLGKAVLDSVEPPQGWFTGPPRTFICNYTMYFDLVNARDESNPPQIFIEGYNNWYLLTRQSFWTAAGHWQIELLTMGDGTTEYHPTWTALLVPSNYMVPKVHYFQKATGTEALHSNYGLSIHKSNGSTVYDSRTDKKILTVASMVNTVASNGRGFAVPRMGNISRPAIMCSTKAVYYYYEHKRNAELFLLYTKINTSGLYYNYIIPTHSLARSISEPEFPDGFGTYGSGESLSVPVIDAADYD